MSQNHPKSPREVATEVATAEQQSCVQNCIARGGDDKRARPRRGPDLSLDTGVGAGARRWFAVAALTSTGTTEDTSAPVGRRSCVARIKTARCTALWRNAAVDSTLGPLANGGGCLLDENDGISHRSPLTGHASWEE